MRFHDLDLNLLVALDALLSTRNVTKAARQEHLSQSGMSNALARLRAYFGDDLLVPVGRAMELTPLAESLREAVHDLLLRLETTITVAPHFDPELTDRTFQVSSSDYTTLLLFPHVSALVAARRSSASFRLHPPHLAPQQALELGSVDLHVLPESFAAPDHPKEWLFDEELVCLVWTGSRLAEGELTLERFLAARHVAMEPPTANGAPTTSLPRTGFDLDVAVRSPVFTPLPSLIVGTDMVATVHARLARLAARHLPLTCRPAPVALEPLRMFAQWHKYRSRDPGLVWLRGLLQDAVQRMDATPVA
jgi:DNA-binding transcriptional LysR family regulator